MTSRTGAVLAGLLAAAAAPLPPLPLPLPVARADSFEDLARRAGEAREAGQLEAAASLYREAVEARPDWAEGWWYLGTLAYDGDHAAQCRQAFDRFLALQPGVGPALGLRGLCAFEAGDYEDASRDLDGALGAGPVDDEPIWHVITYHRVLLLVRAGQFERALPPLTELAQTRRGAEELLEVCGLLLLRRAELPTDVEDGDRPLVRLAGEAECAALADQRAEAEKRFAELIGRHPDERHVHYAYGLFLAGRGSRDAIDAYRREIELFPDHVLAHVELAFNLLTHGHPEEAKRVAETAIRLDPGLFAAHFALGRAAVETGDPTLGVFELETAGRLAPGVPEIQLALARAYARAGRGDDADRANRRFQELEQARRTAKQAP